MNNDIRELADIHRKGQPERRCACGCGLPAPRSYSTHSHGASRYIRGHHNRAGVPIPEATRTAICEEIAANAGWKSVGWEGYERSVRPDDARVRNALGTALKLLEVSPTFRRVIADLERDK